MKQRLALGLMLLVGMAAAGCDDDDDVTPTDAGLNGDGAGGDAPATDGGDGPQGDGGAGDGTGGDGPGGMASATIGPAGGQLVSGDGRLTVTFPRGALTQSTDIEIKTEAAPPAGALGTVYVIEPDGTRLQKPAIVTIRYTTAELGGGQPDDSRLGLYRTGQWNELTRSKPNTATALVSGDLAQLGVVGLLPGLCRVCSATCDLATCRFGADPAVPGSGVEGKCAALPKGCNRCVPKCDADGDGFCSGGTTNEQPGGDCNDQDATMYPDALEVCGNGLDDDCDNHVDDGCTVCTTDAQCPAGREACVDGLCSVCVAECNAGNCFFGDDPPATPVMGRCAEFGVGCNVCVPACDQDGDGYCEGEPGMRQPGGDCDDNNKAVSPKASEICGNGLDDDCNTHVDDGCEACSTDSDCPRALLTCRAGACEGCKATCNAAACMFGGLMGKCATFGKEASCSRCVPTCDTDGDGYCPLDPGNNQPGGDCDDGDASIYPTATEICGNNDDDDCDGRKDEGCKQCENDAGCSGAEACLDGFCEVCTAGCDASAMGNCRFGALPEMPGTGVVGRCQLFGNGCNKCVPTCDMDGDGVCPQAAPGNEQPGGDCNDMDAKVSPMVREVCGNMVDDDCDTRVDEACATCATANASCGTAESCSTTR